MPAWPGALADPDDGSSSRSRCSTSPRSADALLVLVIGGSGYLYGGLIGAIAFKLMKDTLSAMTPAYWTFWMGAILVTLVMIGRDRLVAQVARPFTALLRRVRARRTRGGEP